MLVKSAFVTNHSGFSGQGSLSTHNVYTRTATLDTATEKVESRTRCLRAPIRVHQPVVCVDGCFHWPTLCLC